MHLDGASSTFACICMRNGFKPETATFYSNAPMAGEAGLEPPTRRPKAVATDRRGGGRSIKKQTEGGCASQDQIAAR